MTKRSDYTEQEIEMIRQTAEELRQRNTIFYTGHCTGKRAIDIMRSVMGGKLVQMHCGMKMKM